MLYLRRLGRILPAKRAGIDRALRTSDQEFQHPDARVRRYLLEAARKDPRYLPILPTLFTVAEADIVPSRTASVVTTYYDLLNVKDEYPPNLREFYSRAVLVDPSGIAPFLPYLHSDLSRIIDKYFEPERRASPAPNIEGDDQSPCDDDDFELYWDFKTVTFGGIVNALLTVVLSIVIVCITAPYLGID